MHAISTAAFVSILALASTLAFALPQGKPATGPAQQPSPASLNPSPFDKAAPCTDTFTVPQAEPCDTLVTKLGLSKADILSLNSGLSCDSNIPAGKVLCIKDPKQKSPRALPPKPQNPAPAQAPACKTHATATETTCNGLAPKFGLTPKKFVEFNNNVNEDCTNLVPGQAYCVALD
ncbi:hypothetical protein H4582DRAFT_1940237 [Lactarius indigo]|nr:hypothetical protein H4582DRAFT_1940237 [Lactarius indigo]